MSENPNSDVINELSSLYKDKERGIFKVPIPSIPGEYFYNRQVTKFDLEEVSFTGLYMKIPQVIPVGEHMDVRFSLSAQNPQIFWAKGVVTKVNENRIFLEFVEIPRQTIQTIEEFMEILAEKNAKRNLGKY